MSKKDVKPRRTATPSRMRGGHALVRALEACGVDMVFGLPGNEIAGIYHALLSSRKIRHMVVRHEQSAAFMADAYSRFTGKVGTALTISGPGAANSMGALLEAYCCSSRVLSITGQVPSHLIGKGKGALHETRDQLGMFAGVTGHNERISSVARIPGAVREAVHSLFTRRPRPAHLEVPHDVILEEDMVELPSFVLPRPIGPDPRSIRVAADMLCDSRRPAIYAGGGIHLSEAWVELKGLAEQIQAPVFTSINGKGALPADHPLFMGQSGLEGPGQEYLLESDCLLAVGTRFDFIATDSWGLKLPPQLIQIDIDPAELGKNYPASLGIVADAKQALASILSEVMKRQRSRRPSRAGELAPVRSSVYAAAKERNPDALTALEAIRAATRRDAIIAWDVTVISYWALKHFPVFVPRTFTFATGSGGMGIAVPSAIAARAAYPRRQVVAICGDGGFMFTFAELATAMKYRLPFPVILFNDNCYGSIKDHQLKAFGEYVDADLVNPDFGKVAQAFGGRGVRLSSIARLGAALKAALKSPGLTIIEAPFSLETPY